MKRNGILKNVLNGCFAMMMAMPALYALAPQITGWSSNGSGAENPQDIMYLVNQGESVIFTVTVDQSVSYEWQANKTVDSSATTNTYAWSVPHEKGIWEIHLKVWNADNEEVHKEWVISTLDVTEAPAIFESFSDGKYNDRTETDPWGRIFNWTSPTGYQYNGYYTQVNSNDLKNMFFSGAINKQYGLYTNSNVLYGTWDFYFRFPNGGNTSYNDNMYGYISANLTPTVPLVKIYHAADEHIGTDYFDGNSKCHPFAARDHNSASYSALGCISDTCEGNSIGIGRGWHHMRFIRDKRTGYNLLWQGLETVEEPFIAENFTYSKDLTDAKSIFWGLYEDGIATDGRYSIQHIDQIAIYNETYLYPPKSILVSSSKIKVKNGLDPSSLWTLKEIVNAVNDPSKMEYNDSSKTAYLHVDTFDFNYATGFEMDNETLVFTSSHPNWKWRSGLYLKLNNAKIIGQNNILLIDASNVEMIRNKSVKNKMYVDIDSSSFINVNGPKFGFNEDWIQHLNITNSYFLLNKTSSLGGPAALSFGLSQSSLYDWDVILDNNTFEMAAGAFQGAESEAIIRLQGGNPHFYNSVFKGGLGFRVSQGSGSCINCNLADAILFNQAYDGSFYVKYYADIHVKDENGNDLSNIRLDIHNEVDDSLNHDIENLLLPQNHWVWYDDPPPNSWYHRHNINDEANEQTTFYTGSNGHTELPSWESNSVVLLDYIKDISGKKYYTYKITAEKDGVIDSVVGINPDTLWYRTDPSIYPGTPERGTITIVLPVTGIEEENAGLIVPLVTQLLSCAPNPFTGQTTINFQLAKPAQTAIMVYNLMGQVVKTLVNECLRPGYHSVKWDGKDANGNKMAVGVYLYRMQAGKYSATRKLTIVR